MKINNFQGDPTETSARKEALNRGAYESATCVTEWSETPSRSGAVRVNGSFSAEIWVKPPLKTIIFIIYKSSIWIKFNFENTSANEIVSKSWCVRVCGVCDGMVGDSDSL